MRGQSRSAHRRTRGARTCALLVVVVVAASSLADARVATPGITVPNGYTLASRARLAPEVIRYTIVRKSPAQRIHVVRAPTGAAVDLNVVLSRGRLMGPTPRTQRTSAMCRVHSCLAGINGSFFNVSAGRPIGAVVADGEPVQSSRSPREQVIVARNGRMSFGRLSLTPTVVARYPTRVTLLDLGIVIDEYEEERPLRGDAVNVWRKARQMNLFTQRFGPRTPNHTNGAELVAEIVEPRGPVRVDTPITIRPLRLRWKGGTRIQNNHVVLSAHGPKADELVEIWRDIRSGRALEEVTLQVRSSPRAWDSLAGGPVLVRDGRIDDTTNGPGSRTRAPRSIMGWNADGDVLLVTIDGRRPGARGMTLLQAARFMRQLGAVGAINLDGGGSTTYVERGRLRNAPSDVLVVRNGKRVRAASTLARDRVVRRIERPVAVAVLLVPS